MGHCVQCTGDSPGRAGLSQAPPAGVGSGIAGRTPRGWAPGALRASEKALRSGFATLCARQEAPASGQESTGDEAKSPDAGAREHRRRGRKPRYRGTKASPARQEAPLSVLGSIGGKAREHRRRGPAAPTAGQKALDPEPRLLGRSAGFGRGGRSSEALASAGAAALPGHGPSLGRTSLSALGSWHIHVPLVPCPGRAASSAGVEAAASTAHVLPRPSPKLRCCGCPTRCRPPRPRLSAVGRRCRRARTQKKAAWRRPFLSSTAARINRPGGP